MRKKDIERKLMQAFSAATPDRSEEILKECSEKKKGVVDLRTDRTEKKTGTARSSGTRRFGVIAVAALAAVLLLTGAVAGVIGIRHLRAEPKAASEIENIVAETGGTPMPSPLPAETAAPLSTSLPLGRTPTLTPSPLPAETAVPFGLMEAIQAAKQHANVPENTEAEARTAKEDGVRVYNVRFGSDGAAYEYDIRIEDGTIIKGEMELWTLPESAKTRNAVTLEQAKAIALDHAGVQQSSAVFSEQKNGHENGRTCYEIEWRLDGVEYDYEIDTETGVILSWSYELEDLKRGGVETENTSAYIGEETAKKIALKDANAAEENARFTKCRLDEDDGQIFYKIKFILDDVEYEYEIEALTGAVIERDIDFEELKIKDGAGDIGKEKAKAIALSDANVSEADAQSLKCKKDTDDGRTVYEIKFAANGIKYEYEIDAASGTILDKDRETGGEKSSKKTAAPDGSKSSYIGAAKAKSIALGDAGVSASEAERMKCKLETNEGEKVYEVEFEAGGFEYEYEIDAVTGKILSRDKERAD